MKPSPTLRHVLGATFVACCLAHPVHAQWLTQTFTLRSGWNAIYTHVDAGDRDLNQLVGALPIEEVWMWAPRPVSLGDFVRTPGEPAPNSLWLHWERAIVEPETDTLTRLPGGAAFLVRATEAVTWNVVGKPRVPSYQWSSQGLNLIGFPTVETSPATTFADFFRPDSTLLASGTVFAYRPRVPDPESMRPRRILDFEKETVPRGEAFWISAGGTESAPIDNRYFGPFSVVFPTSEGARFGDSVGQIRFLIRNQSEREVTVTLARVNSEPAPVGESEIHADPLPILVRGSINTTNLTFNHTALADGPTQWTLPRKGDPGSAIEVVLGVDRQRMAGSPGQRYAAILRFTDSLNLTRIDVGATAEVSSRAGLWVGAASVSSVNHDLNTYASATNLVQLTNVLTRLGLREGVDGYHYELDREAGRILVFGGPPAKEARTGSYLLDGPARVDEGEVASPYPLRLILHHDGTNTRLLQRVFYAVDTNANPVRPVLTTRESLIQEAKLTGARRISAVHLPFFAENLPWRCDGTLSPGGSLSTVVQVGLDDQANNPFLHTFHPDHDNRDAEFRDLGPAGTESYAIRRRIRMALEEPAEDFDSRTRGPLSLQGIYSETVTFTGGQGTTNQYSARGTFRLNRIADLPDLIP